MSKTRSYSQLRLFHSFFDRFDYLQLGGEIGLQTFGFDRWINQRFYRSREWRRARNDVIARDNGCDLGVPDYKIYSDLLVHHMNPVQLEDIINGEDWLIDPEFLVTTTLQTHNAIHYGDRNLLPQALVERELGDTTLW